MKHEIQDKDWLLLVKFLNKECNEVERREFEEWLKKADANGLSNNDLFEKVKDDLKEYDNLSVIRHPNPKTVWNKITDKIESDNNPEVTSIDRFRWYKYAAVLTMLLVASIAIFSGYFNNDSDQIKFTSYKHVTEKNSSVIQLSDGSKVWLSKNSTLGYSNFNSLNKRIVELKGQAYFEVARNEDKPFIIHVGKSNIKVLGTSFNVNQSSQNKKTIVSVTHGLVAFSNESDQKVLLAKDEQGVFDSKDNSINKTAITDLNFLSWKTGILRFEDLEMSKVCEALSKHYKTDINFIKHNNSDLRLTANFNNQDIEQVIQIISETLDLEIDRSNSTITLINRNQQ